MRWVREYRDCHTAAVTSARAWCVRTGHGLGAKDHEADRWVAAVAGGYPLATEDAIFDDVVTLRRKFPDV